MKLDSIVYDYSNLQNAIAITLNQESPTFQAMYPSDTATSLVNVLASYGSMLQYQLVSAMANMYTDSAYSEAGIRQLAETLGNRLHGNISSQLYCNIERLNLRGKPNVIIPAYSKFTIGDLNFFNPDAIVFGLTTDDVQDVKLIQGEYVVNEYTTNGISGEKIYFCEDFKCNTNYVHVYVEGEEWNTTDSFLPYVVSDDSITNETQVVILRTDADGRTYIKFGNNSNGLIPANNTKVKIEFVKNEGADGNLNNSDLDIILNTPIYYSDNTSQRVRLETKITSKSTVSGGFNTQSLEVLKESSPYVFASGDRAVRREDYKAMLLNKYGFLTANVWGEYEEAAINGGYDKIMMNMVYYTGIKSIQKYDYYPVNTGIELDPSTLATIPDDFYSIDGNISNANGFLGSYEIELKSYDTDNKDISVKYRDALGTGILTCDPSINQSLIVNSADPATYYEKYLFPINDFANLDAEKVTINQYCTPDGSAHDAPINLLEGNFDISSGYTTSQQPMVITYNNPFQIRIDLGDGDEESNKSIVAFAFKTPKTANNFKYFPYQLAIYATKDIIPSFDNIKNDSKWAKITGVQTLRDDTALDSYTDWITTNVYVPGNKTTYEDVFNTEDDWGQYLGEDKTLIYITNSDLFLSKDLEYTLKINNAIQTRYLDYDVGKYTVIISGQPVEKDCVLVNRHLSADEINKTVLYGTLASWSKYRHYVIEVYGIQDRSLSSPRQISIQQIKALYKESSSYINYDLNQVYLNLPILTDEETETKSYALPKAMQYYQYTVVPFGITEANGYKKDDVLTYQLAEYNITFNIKVVSLENSIYEITVTNDEAIQNSSLKGKIPVNVENVALTGGLGTGAQVTVTSDSIVDMYANYTGNYYTNKDIQAADLPIMNKYNHFTTYMEFKQPHIKNIEVYLTLEYDDITSFEVTKNKVIDAVLGLFDIHPDSMGAKCNVSDIWKAVNSVAGIKRFNVTSPINNIDCMPYELLVLPKANLHITDILTNEFK